MNNHRQVEYGSEVHTPKELRLKTTTSCGERRSQYILYKSCDVARQSREQLEGCSFFVCKNFETLKSRKSEIEVEALKMRKTGFEVLRKR